MEKDAQAPKAGCFSAMTDMNNPQAIDVDGTVRFGAYVFHRQQRRVSKSGWPVPLGGRALDILTVLLEAPGQYISKATLIERVWPNSVVEENNLRVHIAALRRALGDGRCGGGVGRRRRCWRRRWKAASVWRRRLEALVGVATAVEGGVGVVMAVVHPWPTPPWIAV